MATKKKWKKRYSRLAAAARGFLKKLNSEYVDRSEDFEEAFEKAEYLINKAPKEKLEEGRIIKATPEERDQIIERLFCWLAELEDPTVSRESISNPVDLIEVLQERWTRRGDVNARLREDLKKQYAELKELQAHMQKSHDTAVQHFALIRRAVEDAADYPEGTTDATSIEGVAELIRQYLTLKLPLKPKSRTKKQQA